MRRCEVGLAARLDECGCAPLNLCYFLAMVCSDLSPLQIDLVNVVVTTAPWAPAILSWVFVTSWCWQRIEASYPGRKHQEWRTTLCLVTTLGSLIVFFGVWCVGAALTEGFRCAFA